MDAIDAVLLPPYITELVKNRLETLPSKLVKKERSVTLLSLIYKPYIVWLFPSIFPLKLLRDEKLFILEITVPSLLGLSYNSLLYSLT